jgi:hypothetical protein
VAYLFGNMLKHVERLSCEYPDRLVTNMEDLMLLKMMNTSSWLKWFGIIAHETEEMIYEMAIDATNVLFSVEIGGSKFGLLFFTWAVAAV